jgi:DNA-3-methyladenine glycosylase II
MEAAIAHLKRCDPVLARIIERVGQCRMQYRAAAFATLARAIVFQQLNGKAALTIHDRLVAAAGGELRPESILKLRLPTLRKAGLSKQKATYIRDLARHAAEGSIDFDALPALPDDEVIRQLTQVKGVGTWTAHMFLIFALRRPDVLPTGDYGVRDAMRRAYRLRQLPSPQRMQQIARAWQPHRSVACWYLWRSLDIQN